MGEIFEYCELCSAPLDADNCYGEEIFPLCRYHHEMVGIALAFIVKSSGIEKEPRQLSFFQQNDKKKRIDKSEKI